MGGDYHISDRKVVFGPVLVAFLSVNGPMRWDPYYSTTLPNSPVYGSAYCCIEQGVEKANPFTFSALFCTVENYKNLCHSYISYHWEQFENYASVKNKLKFFIGTKIVKFCGTVLIPRLIAKAEAQQAVFFPLSTFLPSHNAPIYSRWNRMLP